MHVGRAQRPRHEGDDQHQPEECGDEDLGVPQRAGLRGGRDPVEEEREAGREQQHADPVEGLGRLDVVLGQHDRRVDQRRDADRQVDQEDPVPGRGVDEPAAEDRAEDRAEQHRDAEHRHHPSDPLGSGGAGQDRHAERHQHAAAEPLQHSEGDQLLERVGGRAEHRAGGEQHERQQVQPLGAEAVGRPAGQRDHARQRERVAGHRPGDLRRGGGELLLEGPQRHRDDGDVEDRHDGAEDDDAGDDEDAPVETVLVWLGLLLLRNACRHHRSVEGGDRCSRHRRIVLDADAIARLARSATG
jgi:hypothetical protein